LRALAGAAVRAEDSTVTWIAPVLTPAGWVVQPLNPDCYGGLAGLALLFTGYLAEVRAGRADPVDAVPGLLADVLRTLRAAEDQTAIDRRGERPRPETPGGYLGLGSRIWCWLLLRRLGAAGDDALRRARALAEQMPEGVRVDATYDVLSGMAGGVVPLLRLSEVDSDPRWPAYAVDIAARLDAAARRTGRHAAWPNSMFPEGLGGFAHGATGIGWAMARLALATRDETAGRLAEAAFGYEESLYDPGLGGWRDLREPDGDWAAATWCHGAGGIGIAAADLLRRTGEPRWADMLRRAAAHCWSTGMSWNHTLCHGDLGNWEVVRAAIAEGLAPDGVDRSTIDGYVLASVAEFGPISGLARDAFSPGLLPGIGGVAYQLLRMHPDCPLPSVLLPDG
jgi:lantibiotic modifying enzyme